jgi:hypothetical protein
MFAFVGVISSCVIVFAIWPGELKLFAPIFCTDAQPDPFVVSDTTSPRPGETNTNFTLFCMGPRGDATDVGLLRPFLAASILNGVVLMIPLLVLGAIRASSAVRAARSQSEPASTATPALETAWESRSGGHLDEHPDSHWNEGSDEHSDGRVEPATSSDDPDSGSDARRGRSLPPPGSTAGPFID